MIWVWFFYTVGYNVEEFFLGVKKWRPRWGVERYAMEFVECFCT